MNSACGRWGVPGWSGGCIIQKVAFNPTVQSDA
jgi:hypothetical protein